MIYDTLSNLGNYSCIPFVGDLADFLACNDIGSRDTGSYPIIGQDLILNKSRYIPAHSTNDRFEAHRNYADVHLVLAGQEIIRTAFPDDTARISAYNPDDDVEFFSAEKDCTEFILTAGKFLYLAPGEIHQPGCSCGDYRGEVEKCVVKIRCP